MGDNEMNRNYLINKVWEIANDCSDEGNKGRRVRLRDFWEATDALDFGRKQVRGALDELERRAHVLTFADEDGHISAIRIVPQRYQCWHCGMWLGMQDDPEGHVDFCLRRQAKIERMERPDAWRFAKGSSTVGRRSSSEGFRTDLEPRQNFLIQRFISVGESPAGTTW